MIEVLVSPAAERDLGKMASSERQRVLRGCVVLHSDPVPKGKKVKQLSGFDPPLYRLRVGDYRVVYRVEGERVVVLAVMHRSELEAALSSLR